MNGRVICVFHAPFTMPRRHSEWRTVAIHKIRVEKHGAVRPELGELRLQLAVAKFTETSG